MPVPSHHLLLPLGLNPKRKRQVIMRWRVQIHEGVLLVEEHMGGILLCPHSNTYGVWRMLLPKFLGSFIAYVPHKGVTGDNTICQMPVPKAPSCVVPLFGMGQPQWHACFKSSASSLPTIETYTKCVLEPANHCVVAMFSLGIQVVNVFMKQHAKLASKYGTFAMKNL